LKDHLLRMKEFPEFQFPEQEDLAWDVQQDVVLVDQAVANPVSLVQLVVLVVPPTR
jgi:hypothetical protein